MAEQRIYLDNDNKLVIETDNGCTHADGTVTSNIDANKEFKVSGEDVLKLFGLVNKTECIFPYIKDVKVGYGWWSRQCTCTIITKDGAVKEALKGVDEKYESYEKQIKDLESQNYDLKKALENSKVDTKIDEVKQIIRKYNDSRHWWERKIKID